MMVTAETRYGRVEGVWEDGISVFRGIPYAKPPVGELRFAPPQDPEKWSGIRKCLEYPPAPIQYFEPKDPLPIPQLLENCSEDCLYLNVMTPASLRDSGRIDSEERLPVYVFLYGGGYSTGGSHLPLYQGEKFAQNGIVYVNLNYRLNIFGFLSFETLLEQYQTTGNWGILDIIKALEWVKENISQFGGDPENITLGGQSAGSMTVSLLLHSERTKGLFHRCILESGVIQGYQMQRASVDHTAEVCRKILKKLDIDDDRSGIEKLRSLPAQQLLETWSYEKRWKRRFLRPVPALDSYVVPREKVPDPRRDAIHEVDLLFGYNSDEGSMFCPKINSREEYLLFLKSYAPEAAEDIFARFPVDENHSPSRRAAQVISYMAFQSCMIPYGEVLSKKNRVYAYHFDYQTPQMKREGLGCRHMAELYYVFGNQLRFIGADNEAGYRLSDFMVTAWSNFIRFGDPNKTDPLPRGVTWKPYDSQERNQLLIGEEILNRTIPDMENMIYFESIIRRRSGHR